MKIGGILILPLMLEMLKRDWKFENKAIENRVTEKLYRRIRFKSILIFLGNFRDKLF